MRQGRPVRPCATAPSLAPKLTRAGAGVEAATAIDPTASDRLLLERLGAALVAEWNNLPPPLQRAVYERAAGGRASLNSLATRRQMARFLHDHKKPDPA